MVGAAQYRDEEIDWVLTAVVNKKKQLYIQTKFKDKFGRSLNHNQIRYIKNKYGKDPRFNSPLVNTKAPRTGASPPESVLGENEDDDEGFASPTIAGPSREQPREDRSSSAVLGTPSLTTATPLKRKRSIRDEGDDFESMLQHSAKTQRLNPPPPVHTPSMSQLLAGAATFTSAAADDAASRWNAARAQSAVAAPSHHAHHHQHYHVFSPPAATPETAYAGMYDARGQPSLQGTSGGSSSSSNSSSSINWATGPAAATSSASTMVAGNAWDFAETPGLVNTGGAMQNVPALSPAELGYYADQTPAAAAASSSYAFPSPVAAAQHHPQQIPPTQFHHHQQQQQQQQRHASMLPPHFTPSILHLSCSPYSQGQGQGQQQEHTHGYGSSQDGFDDSRNLHRRRQTPIEEPSVLLASNPPPHHTSAEHTTPIMGIHHHHLHHDHDNQPVPSFEQVPIEDASCENTPRRSSSPAAQDWSGISYAPYEPSPFDPVQPAMGFPFEHVGRTGITAASSRVMYGDLCEKVESQRQRLRLDASPSPSSAPSINPVVSSLEMLRMVATQQPTAAAAAVPLPQSFAYHHPHHLPQISSAPASTFPSYHGLPPPLPRTTTAAATTTHGHHGAEVNPFTTTIDPRLLSEQQYHHNLSPTLSRGNSGGEGGGHSFGVSPPPDLPKPE